jgi:hypothetical protein
MFKFIIRFGDLELFFSNMANLKFLSLSSKIIANPIRSISMNDIMVKEEEFG